MDDYLFQQHLHECETVYERTQYLEILNYAVGSPRELSTNLLTSRQHEGFKT
jgi:hypothetical protein